MTVEGDALLDEKLFQTLKHAAKGLVVTNAEDFGVVLPQFFEQLFGGIGCDLILAPVPAQACGLDSREQVEQKGTRDGPANFE